MSDGTKQLEVTNDPTDCKVIIREMVKRLREGKPTREMAVAITKLQEAEMWLNEHQRANA